MGNIIFFAVLAITIIFEIVTKKRLPENQISQDSLTKKEKALTWILCILNPIIAGAILYYGWKKRLPIKAKQANKISLLVALIEILLAGLLFFLFVI